MDLAVKTMRLNLIFFITKKYSQERGNPKNPRLHDGQLLSGTLDLQEM